MIGYKGVQDNLKIILRDGLEPCHRHGVCAHVCLSDKPEIAANFGVVLEVDLTGIQTDGFSGGETRVHGVIPPEKIKVFKGEVKKSWDGFLDPASFKFGNRLSCLARFN